MTDDQIDAVRTVVFVVVAFAFMWFLWTNGLADACGGVSGGAYACP